MKKIISIMIIVCFALTFATDGFGFTGGPILLVESSSVAIEQIDHDPTGSGVVLLGTFYLNGCGFNHYLNACDIVTAHINIYRDDILVGGEVYVTLTGYQTNTINCLQVPITVSAQDKPPVGEPVTYYLEVYYAVNHGQITGLYASTINFLIFK